jgi:hypothetical protein
MLSVDSHTETTASRPRVKKFPTLALHRVIPSTSIVVLVQQSVCEDYSTQKYYRTDNCYFTYV